MPLLSAFRHLRRSSSHSSQTSHASAHQEARQQRRYKLCSIVNIFILFTIFLLLLLVSLSVPITNSIYLLSMHAAIEPDFGFGFDLPQTSAATTLRFGAWGFCAYSSLRLAGLNADDARCTTPALGYDVDPGILELTGHPEVIEALLHSLVTVLVIHPVSVGLVFATLVLSILSLLSLFYAPQHRTRAHKLAVAALVFGVLAALLTTLSAIFDISLVAVARDRVGELSDNEFVVGWGNAVWMTLVGAILSWVSVVVLSSLVCGCCGQRWRPGGFRGRKHRKMEEAEASPMQEKKPVPSETY